MAHTIDAHAGTSDAAAFSKSLDALSKKEADAKQSIEDAKAEHDARVAKARAAAIQTVEKASAQAEQEREAILADASYDIDKQTNAILAAAKAQSQTIAGTRNAGLAKKIAAQLVA